MITRWPRRLDSVTGLPSASGRVKSGASSPGAKRTAVVTGALLSLTAQPIACAWCNRRAFVGVRPCRYCGRRPTGSNWRFPVQQRVFRVSALVVAGAVALLTGCAAADGGSTSPQPAVLTAKQAVQLA